jgi:SRSO17 transposase
MNKINKNILTNPKIWGINEDFLCDIEKTINKNIRKFKDCFKTKTSSMSKYAKDYIMGLIQLDTRRNIKNISRRVDNISSDGQNIQHFISDSTWKAEKVFDKIQREIIKNKQLSDGILILDDSGDRKFGNQSAGVGRQYIGRDGKVENGQVAVCVGYYKDDYYFAVDGELYIPKEWFTKHSKAVLNGRWKIPTDRVFKTKLQIGMDLILKALNNGLSFSYLTGDAWYGRDSDFRNILDNFGIKYVLDIPITSSVLSELNLEGESGTSPFPIKDNQYLMFEEELSKKSVRRLIKDNGFERHRLEIRSSSRGVIINNYYLKEVETSISGSDITRKELLLIREESDGNFKASLSNALDEDVLTIAKVKCSRYFVERTFQELKTELGWAELLARKYSSFMHHFSLCSLALYILMNIKLLWKIDSNNESLLKDQLEIKELPYLSINNIRELIRVLFPLNSFTIKEMCNLISQHLFNRCRSLLSEYRKQIRTDIYKEV